MHFGCDAQPGGPRSPPSAPGKVPCSPTAPHHLCVTDESTKKRGIGLRVTSRQRFRCSEAHFAEGSGEQLHDSESRWSRFDTPACLILATLQISQIRRVRGIRHRLTADHTICWLQPLTPQCASPRRPAPSALPEAGIASASSPVQPVRPGTIVGRNGGNLRQTGAPRAVAYRIHKQKHSISMH